MKQVIFILLLITYNLCADNKIGKEESIKIEGISKISDAFEKIREEAEKNEEVMNKKAKKARVTLKKDEEELEKITVKVKANPKNRLLASDFKIKKIRYLKKLIVFLKSFKKEGHKLNKKLLSSLKKLYIDQNKLILLQKHFITEDNLYLLDLVKKFMINTRSLDKKIKETYKKIYKLKDNPNDLIDKITQNNPKIKW